MYTDRSVSQLSTSHPRQVFLAIGSCEQHGPHLPIDTDLRIAQLIVDKLALQYTEEDALVLPALPFSCSWEHKGTGMVAINTATLALVLHDIAQSLLTWNDPLVFILVNWHGGNASLGSIATEISAQHGLSTFALQPLSLAQRLWQQTYGPLANDIHAGAVETAIIKAFWPQLVNETAYKTEIPVSPGFENVAQPLLQAVGIGAVSSHGVWGRPDQGHADQGKEIIQQVIHVLEQQIQRVLDAVGRQERGAR